jgi:hypothetical protein
MNMTEKMKLYLVESPEHDYDSISSAVILANDETDARALFAEQPSAGIPPLTVIDVTDRIGVRGVLHSEFHAG